MIRTYNDDDLQAIWELLSENMKYDTITETVLREKLYDDPNWNPGTTYIAEEEGKVVGFLQGVYRDIRGTRYGYIKLLAVDTNYRKRGVAKAMYQRLEETYKAIEVDVMRVYDVPLNYFMPGVDPRYTPAVCFVERMGFVRNGDTSNLLVSLQDQDWSVNGKLEKLKQHNIEVSRATEADREDVYELASGDWVLWRHEIDMAYKSNPPSLHIARLDGKVKAFSAHNANNKGTAWFGPMLTHDDMRGKGIGGVLLKLCLEDMKQEGHSDSIIPWVGPIPFYAFHANAQVDRVFWRYEKKLK